MQSFTEFGRGSCGDTGANEHTLSRMYFLYGLLEKHAETYMYLPFFKGIQDVKTYQILDAKVFSSTRIEHYTVHTV